MKLKSQLVLTTAAIALLCPQATRAFAGSCSGVSGSYTCSGPADSGNDTQQNLQGIPLMVTTQAGFGIAVTNGHAFDLQGQDVTFDDQNQSTITGNDFAILSQANGQTKITVTGTVTATGGTAIGVDGSPAYPPSGPPTGPGATTIITGPGKVSGAGGGIAIYQNDGGHVSVQANGDVDGGQDAGIRAITQFVQNFGSTVSVITAAGTTVSGETDGIVAGFGQYTFGTPSPSSVTITANGKVTGGSGSGIHAAGFRAGTIAVVVNAGAEVAGGLAGVSFNSRDDLGSTPTLSNAGIVRNLSGQSFDVAIMSENGPVAATNTNQVIGTVQLLDSGNSFTNKAGGVWNTAGGTNEFNLQPQSATNSNFVDNQAGATIIAGAPGAGAATTTTFNGLATFTNAGRIEMQNGVVGDRTVVTGNFIGKGGTVTLDTTLAGDGSPSDRLVLDGGTASGTTFLAIHNVRGSGAQTTGNGIEVVEAINDATSDPAAFKLAEAAKVGAFDYNLFYSSLAPSAADQNWYLRSTGKLNPSAQANLPYADVLSHFALDTLGTLQQRTGNRIWPNGTPLQEVWCKNPEQNFRCTTAAEGPPMLYGQGAWGRAVGLYSSFAPRSGSAYDLGLGFLQAGYEGVLHESDGGAWTTGTYVMVGHAQARIAVTPDPVTGAARTKGKISTTGYGLGANLTWLSRDGWYADAVGQLTWYQSNLSSKPGGDNQGWSSALSLEAGKRFDIGSGWTLVPQAQIVWTHVAFDSFSDDLDNKVRIGKGDRLEGRAGLRVENLAAWQDEAGWPRRLQTYAIANLNYAFLDGTSVEVAGTTLSQKNRRLWGEIGAGASFAWNDKWSLYGEADYAHALASGSNYTAKGTAGLRYRW